MAAPTSEYATATLALHLATAVAHADGVIDAQEEAELEGMLERNLYLSQAERRRLRAHLRWLLLDHPGMAGLRARLTAMPDADKAQLAQAVAGIAAADGHVDPTEIKVLGKVYKLLGQAESDIYDHVHQAAAARAEPITVRSGRPPKPGHAIPPPPQAGAGPAGESPFALDATRIASRVAETERVASILGDIFAEKPDELPAQPPGPNMDQLIEGLDAAHTALALFLCDARTWPRANVEAYAETLGLILGGAIETINDATFDLCDAPLIEGDEELEIDPEVAAELRP